MEGQTTLSVSLNVKGLDEAIDAIIRISKGLGPVATATLNEIAEGVVEQAQGLAPVKTGRLRASIGITAQGDNFVEVSATAPYAGYVEFGTIKMSPRPFMRPALAFIEDKYSKLFFEGVLG